MRTSPLRAYFVFGNMEAANRSYQSLANPNCKIAAQPPNQCETRVGKLTLPAQFGTTQFDELKVDLTRRAGFLNDPACALVLDEGGSRGNLTAEIAIHHS